MTSLQWKLVKLYIAVILLNTVGFVFLYFAVPDLQYEIVTENYILESLSAFFLLMAFLVGAFFLFRARHYQPWQYVLIPLLGLVLFLDEVGLGLKYLIGSEKIDLGNDLKFDGFHDVIEIMEHFLPELQASLGDIPFFTLIGLIIVSVGWVIISLNRRFNWIKRFRQWYPHHLPILIFLGAMAVFFLSTIPFDIGLLGRTDLALLPEELFEECAAISMLFSSIYLAIICTLSIKKKTSDLPVESLAKSPQQSV